MKRILNIFLCAIIGLGIVSFTVLPSYAQSGNLRISFPDDIDWSETITDEYLPNESPAWFDRLEQGDLTEILGSLLATGALIVFAIISLAVSLAMYIYLALTLMGIARKLEHPNGWFAWLPILNTILLLQMGEKSPWLILLLLIPGVGALIFSIIMVLALMDITEKRGYDKLLALLILLPIANLVLLGMLAWGTPSSKKALGKEK